MATTTTDVAGRLREAWAKPETRLTWFTTVDHKKLGIRYIVTAFLFFIAGGVEASLMRTQLMQAQNDVLGPAAYNQIFTMHGTTMIFLFATPMVTGLAVYVLPLILGTRDMAFPRLNLFSYWVFLLSGLFIYFSFIVGLVPDGGWFSYVPLTSEQYSPGLNIDFWALGIIFLGISTTTGAINFITTFIKMRAPGMALQRVPLFAWAVFDTSVLIILAVPALTLAAVLLELDRKLGMNFYDASQGGNPLLWQHLFWIWGHPEVYIVFLPAIGVLSMVIPAMARRRIVGYSLLVVASFAIALLSLGLWVHHMFAVGLPLLPISFFTTSSFAIGIASGITIFGWLATIWWGARIQWKTPLLFALGFIVTFVIGGITGIMVAVVPFDWQVHDSYFVVAHFHYVLVGGVVLPIFAGLHYWFPKMTGRMYNETVGQLTFWLIFLGFNITFFPQHILGFLGMPRRVSTYLEGTGWEPYNLISTAGAYVIGAGVIVFLLNALWSMFRGPRAGSNPWNGESLEWDTTSPPPAYNFERLPFVRSLTPLWSNHLQQERSGNGHSDDLEHVEDPMTSGREVITTSILDGVPESVIHLPGDSYAPLIAAFGLLILFSGALIESLALIILGLLIASITVAWWLWRSPESPPAPATVDNRGMLPPRISGPSHLGLWGMAIFIATEAVLFGELITSYFMIASNAPAWPLGGISPPELRIPIILTVIIITSSVAMFWADRSESQGNLAMMRLGLVISILLALTFLSLQGLEYYRKEFMPATNAYASLFFTITGAHGAHFAVGVLMASWVLARSWFAPSRGQDIFAMRNVSWYWHFVGVVWLVVFSVVYLSVRWFQLGQMPSP